MAKKKPSKVLKASYPDNVQFIQWRLTEDQKRAFQAKYSTQSEELLSMVGTMLLANYKMSASYDDANDTVIVSWTCRSEDDPNFGYCMTTRHKDLWSAVALSMHKHFDLCADGEWDIGDDELRDIG